MEFVGRRVKKEFEGHGTFFGVVQSYQPNTGFFKIVYEDGDSEELEFSEVALLLVPLEPLPQPSPQQLESSARKRGRKPKKCRITDTGKSDDNSVINGDVCGDLGSRCGGSSKLILNLNEGLDLNGGGLSCLNNDDHGRNEVGEGAKLHDLDLNAGLDTELDVGIDINEEFIKETSGANIGLIDLNLDVNDDFENLSTEREGELFDLNLQLVEDDVSNLDDYVGNSRAHEMVCTERDAQMRKELVENANMGVSENGDGDMGNVDLCKEQEEENLLKANGVDNVNAAAGSSQRKKRGRKRKDASNNKIEVATPEIVEVDGETGILNSELENREQTPLNGCHSIDCDNGNSVSSRGRRGKKRKELSDNNITLPTSEMGLRRSSRRAKRDALFDQDHVFNTLGLDGNNFQLSSPAASFVFEENITVSGPESFRGHILPPKVELPVPSCNLDLCGVSVFDFLSVYAFLRSFSTLLFLSPFELDGFVASVKSNDSTSLFDSIHVSLLKTLRKHLEVLSDEGSVSASKCLRSLNWDFLDLITWPIFVVEYLLLHSPGYIPGLDLCNLKLCQRDYYKLPVSAKVEMMRNLCDDVIEVEAFRSEINRRTLVTEQHMDFDRNTKSESSRKRKSMMDVASTSCITEDDANEPADWNSDECYLCKMDGNLICCDGCPAAFHPRCVGVVSSLLPEGDWYCPECAIDKDKPWMKVEKSIRGAELLGMDPYGRQYYTSCGYLLVLESCNDQYSFCFYDRDDLPPLIEALESPPFLYDTIINSICKQWNIVREVDGTRNNLDIRSYSIKSAFPNKRQLLDIHPTTLETQNKYKVDAEKKSDEKSIVTTYFSDIDLEIAERDNVVQGTENHTVKVENRLESSEGSAEVSQSFIIDVTKGGLDCSRICTEISPESQIPGNLANAGDHFTISPTLVTRQRKNPNSAKYGNAQQSINKREIISQVHPWRKYVNCYEFARTASSVFEELICKSSDATSAPKSAEGIIAGQLKIVSNRSAEFYWSNIHNSVVSSMKEKCGWCFYCKVPEEEMDCLFIMNDSFPAVESFKSEAFGIQSGNDRKNHLVDIMCHIICMEDHLHGLLLGPWLNPHYSVLWRECVLGVTNITSLKNLLLKVEANLNHLALSTGWRQNVDTVATMGSASHIVMSSSRISSKHGIRRKRTKSSEPQITPSSNAMAGLTLLWWRGGRGSRGLFNWKVLPHSLVSKASRQGGCKKITGILYPEVGEYAKRTKCDAWRAAVETSRSVEQLALQVRELDANIRWDDIGQNNLLSKMDKESKKSARSFKKVIIRRKCFEGTVVRYLLDFGKRRFVPEIVVRHGTMIEDSSSERKKYWLEESHIPLYLLKNFEEKRISRKSNKMSSAKLRESSRIMRKPLKERGFSYLFSRAERLDKYQCQHCNKDVLIREVVCCQSCKGFFHKRHVRKSFGYITDDPTYICHKCPDGEFVKSGDTEGKSGLSKPTNASKQLKLVQSGKRKRRVKGKPQVKSKRAPLVITLRRSARNAERMSKLSSQKTKVKKGKKKKKKAKSQKDNLKKLNNGCWQKKRTPVNSSYWSNGLLLSRKPDDEKLTQFRNKMLLVLAGEVASNNDKPKCNLCCELEYAPNLAYVACEICGVWFHGDALDLTADKILNLIGFKCHKCLNRTPPVCPYNFLPGINSTELMRESNAEMGCAEEGYKDLPLSYNRPEDLKFRSDDGVKNASLNLVLEQQSPGLMPESDQKKKDLTLDEKIFQSNGSVEERKQEVFNAVEAESAISVSDLVNKEAEFSPLTNNPEENSLTNNKLESVASEHLSNSHELSQKQSGDIVYVGRGKRR
ncbi:DDT domain-containing protein PTM-like isoform X1 [Primulina huaijiensis]|uniref:DDT domain-containing protein PTM-like isoform X1 n=1 Tax=Primulina huaijiensis TaxID=1492673 RepID=UPI003CC6E0D0